MEIIDYINWDMLVKDHDLTSGDLSPEQTFTLERVLSEYIKQNK